MIETLLLLLTAYYAPVPIMVVMAHILILGSIGLSRVYLFMLWTALSLLYFVSLYNYTPYLFVTTFNSGTLRFAGILLLGFSLLIEILTRKELGSLRIMGSSEFTKTKEKLVTTGIYAWARHPRHVEHPLIFVGLGLIFGNVLLVAFSVYLFLGLALATYFEEKELIKRYGREYLAYKKKTPAFFV